MIEMEIKPKFAQMVMEDKRPKKRKPETTIEMVDLNINGNTNNKKNNLKKIQENANGKYELCWLDIIYFLNRIFKV